MQETAHKKLETVPMTVKNVTLEEKEPINIVNKLKRGNMF